MSSGAAFIPVGNARLGKLKVRVKLVDDRDCGPYGGTDQKDFFLSVDFVIFSEEIDLAFVFRIRERK